MQQRCTRIQYPLSEQPVSVVNCHKSLIKDLSSSGASLLSTSKLHRNERVVLSLPLSGEEIVLLEGRVKRVFEGGFAISFKHHLSIERMAREADYLIGKFGQLLLCSAPAA